MSDLFIERSAKYNNAEDQYIIHDGRHIFFRLVNFGDQYSVQTATASDSEKDLRVYPHKGRLLAALESCFNESAFEWERQKDRKGREYMTCNFMGDYQASVVGETEKLRAVGELLERAVQNAAGK